MNDHVYKIVELAGSSEQGIEHAVATAIARSAETIRNLRWFEVTEIRGHVEDGRIAHWQIGIKAGFTVE
ncbi:dodecin [Acidisphaera rubrifaciens]|uniref:Dodecin domain-containing protein n=1 Tax=Acidisphaera rubrifaciens HS-AP3 TaxID=1231350 RepID=A0A0D6PB27_9PROT|nr:dodecin [Acidisphaera rubrifaciens]GAN78069.1 hypothetical protein Asru_0603_07 [Acidisphaera rubrifaciens HS-AP3]